jgi:ankyrin repeat protein
MATPLMTAIYAADVAEALAIVASGQGDLGAIYRGETALMMACYWISDETLALAIIATGQGNPGHAVVGDMSALMLAIKHGRIAVANALIATGESNPGFVGVHGQTALMLACYAGTAGYADYSAIALELIATGMSRPEVSSLGRTAIRGARIHGESMAAVGAALEALGL